MNWTLFLILKRNYWSDKYNWPNIAEEANWCPTDEFRRGELRTSYQGVHVVAVVDVAGIPKVY